MKGYRGLFRTGEGALPGARAAAGKRDGGPSSRSGPQEAEPLALLPCRNRVARSRCSLVVPVARNQSDVPFRGLAHERCVAPAAARNGRSSPRPVRKAQTAARGQGGGAASGTAYRPGDAASAMPMIAFLRLPPSGVSFWSLLPQARPRAQLRLRIRNDAIACGDQAEEAEHYDARGGDRECGPIVT